MRISVPALSHWGGLGGDRFQQSGGRWETRGCEPGRWQGLGAAPVGAGAGCSPGRAGFTVCESSTEGPARAGHMKAFALRPFSFGCFGPLFSIALYKLVFNLLFSL